MISQSAGAVSILSLWFKHAQRSYGASFFHFVVFGTTQESPRGIFLVCFCLCRLQLASLQRRDTHRADFCRFILQLSPVEKVEKTFVAFLQHTAVLKRPRWKRTIFFVENHDSTREQNSRERLVM